MNFNHLCSEENTADIVSKHWGYNAVYPLLRVMLNWVRDTAQAFAGGALHDRTDYLS